MPEGVTHVPGIKRHPCLGKGNKSGQQRRACQFIGNCSGKSSPPFTNAGHLASVEKFPHSGRRRTKENARIAGVLVSPLTSDQPLRLRRANPIPARPSPSRLSVAGSGTEGVGTTPTSSYTCVIRSVFVVVVVV